MYMQACIQPERGWFTVHGLVPADTLSWTSLHPCPPVNMSPTHIHRGNFVRIPFLEEDDTHVGFKPDPLCIFCYFRGP